MPSDWVKGTILVRCNSISRGHSAVSLRVIETLVALLVNDLTPVVPLRGSISASGDLSPLSYIAGAVTGNPDILVRSDKGVISAAEALEQIQMSPLVLGPKEGLGLMNGTATSAAVASLALFETHQITILTQILTAMALEALLGRVGNYDDFLSKVRPHKGQTESAKMVQKFLQGSRLAIRSDCEEDARQSSGLLYQDRYALRTAPQWIGPQLEDLMLAHEQVSIELNSTTDNPLIDVTNEASHHGGNFQAVSITSAMEKTRLSLQMMGKLLFAQCSELINPLLNNGLPPNLAADEPSSSYTLKGVDVGMASYMSELAYLANPVSSHVQSAEMHNQAINSLAFISTRYTLQSVELVSLMSASYLYTACQALDLRVLQQTFFQRLERVLNIVNCDVFGQLLPSHAHHELNTKLWAHAQVTWLLTSNKDTNDRATYITSTAVAILAEYILEHQHGSTDEASTAIRDWKIRAHLALVETYTTTRLRFFKDQDTADHLGQASRRIYLFLRKTLGVPFHQGLQDHPSPKEPVSADGSKKRTIGSWISIIYESLRSGQLHESIMDCLSEAGLVGSSSTNDIDEKPTSNRHSLDGHTLLAHTNGHMTNGVPTNNDALPAPNIGLMSVGHPVNGHASPV